MMSCHWCRSQIFILPGIFLLVVMGLAPILLCLDVTTLPIGPGPVSLFRWSHHYWAWMGTIVLMVILAIWLIVEVLLIGLFPITYVTAAIGLLILFLALAPSVRNLLRPWIISAIDGLCAGRTEDMELSTLSQVSLYILLALIGIFTLIVWGWQINVLRGKGMTNPDGSADSWHEQKTHYGIAFADVFFACPANAIAIVVVFVSLRWGTYLLAMAGFWWVWANVMTTSAACV